MKNKNLLLIVLFILLGITQIKAQLTVNAYNGGTGSNGTGQNLQTFLQNNLVGTGVTISNATFLGANRQWGSFDATNTFLYSGTGAGNVVGQGMDYGVILTTGLATNAKGPNTEPWVAGASAYIGNTNDDADLHALASAKIEDKAIIEFDLVPTGNIIEFNYIFGSDEYREFVNKYNDAFGFFLSGPGINGTFSNNAINLATIPNTSTPITINNVNDGSASTGSYVANCKNCSYFIYNGDPYGASTVAPYSTNNKYIQYDGYTVMLKARAQVQCGKTYHLKIAIGDARDQSYDSGVFLQKGSLISNAINMNMITTTGNDTIIEGCSSANICFTRSNTSGVLSMPIILGGSAINGTDYSTIGNNITFPNGQATACLTITPLSDGTVEGKENVKISILNSNCNGNDTVTVQAFIIDGLKVNAIKTDASCSACTGTATATASGTGGTPYTYTWSTGGNTANISSLCANTYTVTAQDVNGCTATTQVTVNQPSPPKAAVSGDGSITCTNTTMILSGQSSTGALSYTWTTADGKIISDPTQSTVTVDEMGTYTLTVTGTGGCTDTKNIVVNGDTTRPVANAGNDLVINCTHPTVSATGTGTGTYSWVTNNGHIVGNNLQATVNIDTPGNYWFMLTGTNGCKDSDMVVVTADTAKPHIQLSVLDTLDCSTTTVSVSAVVTPAAAYQYTWSGPAISNNQNTSIDVTAGGAYSLTVTAPNTCSATKQITVQSDPSMPIAIINAGDASINCINTSVTLDGSSSQGGITNYSWSTVNGNFTSPTNQSTVQVDELGTYSLTVTAGNGCTHTQSFTVSGDTTKPALSSSIPDTITCLKLNSTINVVGASIYTWSTLDGNIVNGATSNALTVNEGGTYQVVGTITASSCKDTLYVVVIADTLKPIISINPTDTLNCVVTSVNLVSNGSNLLSPIYNWTGSNPVQNNTNDTATVNVKGTYHLVVTNNNGCKDSTSITVVRNPGAQVAVASASGPVINCSNSSITLDGSGSTGTIVSYSWTTTNGQIIGNVDSTIVAANAAGTYVLTVTGQGGCTDSMTITVTSDTTMPSLTIQSSDTAITCSTTGLQLTVSGADTYSWTPSTGLSANNVSNPTASPSVTTLYTVYGSLANGCNTQDTVLVKVNNTKPIADAGSTQTVNCAVQSTLLSASGGVNYSWTPNVGLSDTLSQNPTATPTQTTLYTVYVFGTNGCSDFDTVTVLVDNNKPSINAGVNDTINCSKLSVQLNATGAKNYTWSPTLGLSNDSINNPIATPVQTTTYIVTGTNSNGCFNTDTIIVLVDNQIPVIDAGANQTINCTTTSVTLAASGTGTYSWAPSSGLNNTTILSPVAQPAATTTYHLHITAANGCIATDSVLVTVDTITPIITLANTDTVNCNHPSTQITANSNATGQYTWSPSGGLSNNAILNPIANPTVTTAYTLVVTSSNGCSANKSINIVADFAKPIIDAGINDTINCTKTSVQLLATGATNYSWWPLAGLSSASINNPIANPTQTMLYYVGSTGSNGCSATDSILVFVDNAKAVLTVTSSNAIDCIHASTQLNAIGGTNYSWYPATNLSNTSINNPISSATTPQWYYIASQGTNGCATIDSVFVNANFVKPTVDAGPDKHKACNETSIILTASTNAPVHYWSPGILFTDSTQLQPLFNPASGGKAVLTTVGSNGCVATDTVIYTVEFKPSASFTPSQTEGMNPLPIDFINNSAAGFNSYVWNFGDNETSTDKNPSHTYYDVGDYVVTLVGVHANALCNDTAKMNIKVDGNFSIEFPNTFSPNNDGKNDQFFLIIKNGKLVYTEIYNRWGQLLFSKEGANVYWDGNTASGSSCPEGVYYYLIKVEDLKGNAYNYNGYISLFRN